MGQKIVVGPIKGGLRNDILPFNIDNDSFPTLINAYQWRLRVKRKRGTIKLGRLTRYFNSTSVSYNPTAAVLTLNGSGVGNILTAFGLQASGNIIPGTVTLTASGGPTVYTDPTVDGYLTPTGTGGVNTINYATGVITIPAQAGNTVTAIFLYYPGLPVMGLEDLILTINHIPNSLAFDTTYSYEISTAFPYAIHDVSFYKNLPTGFYPTYVQKTNPSPVKWNGQDYQQFFTVNYEGALWAVNGITTPFTTTNIGMQYKAITNVSIGAAGPPATVTLTIVGHGLTVGDFVFINEVVGNTGINFQTGFVTVVVDANNVTVVLLGATVAGAYSSGGIAQYLTRSADPLLDCIRFYDGDPTDGNATTPGLTGTKGWVNFCPPLSSAAFSIATLPLGQYYLVGAKMVIPFKDRLLFIAPVVQTSAAGSQVFLQDTIISSQNGTPYYTCSFTGDPTFANTVFTEQLVPTNQTATAPAWFASESGFGEINPVGIDQRINTVSQNEDVLILGLDRSQIRFIYTGNDVAPFRFYSINSEYGSESTFSTINMDRGVITQGSRGFVMTSQSDCQRIDVPILDEVFQIKRADNGTDRLSSQRDFINEWVYFTYPSDNNDYKFPSQTLFYNYRDNSWAIFRESYTTYGLFRSQSGITWNTVGLYYPTWTSWTVPWKAGVSSSLEPLVIGGNQQGFVMMRTSTTAEGNSLSITDINVSAGVTTVTAPNHCLDPNNFIQISGCLGSIDEFVNGNIYQINPLSDNTFTIDPPVDSTLGPFTYFGGGEIKRLYNPYIQSKEFNAAWGLARKTRIGVQQYLLSTTANSQISLLIFLSQNTSDPYNDGPIVPAPNSVNNSLIYGTVLYTCPESTNLGLTPSNTNLQMPIAVQQEQIWHRVNTSLLGDTVQVGFTMSDEQMQALTISDASSVITGATKSANCILTCAGGFSPGTVIFITGVVGMTQLNDTYADVIDSDATTVTIDTNSTGFDTYIGGGTASAVYPTNAFSEIELHGFIIDVSPSGLLA